VITSPADDAAEQRRDEVLLLDADGVPVSRVTYTDRQVRAGGVDSVCQIAVRGGTNARRAK
jgi:hypothetical protein